MQLKIFNKMNVTRTNHDEVSALLTVTLNKSDYKDKVEKQLINYAKNATVPGFRKGKVPLSMVRKQFEAGIAFEAEPYLCQAAEEEIKRQGLSNLLNKR